MTIGLIINLNFLQLGTARYKVFKQNLVQKDIYYNEL